MDHTAFLARLTGYAAPGRLASQALPIKSKTDKQRQAEVTVAYMNALYEISCAAIRDAYQFILDLDVAAQAGTAKWFTSNDDASRQLFSRICNACYPYIFVEQASIVAVNTRVHWQDREDGDQSDDRDYAFDMILSPVDHYQTITEPQIHSKYLRNAIYRLLSLGYKVEVGLSVVPIPLLFALEHCGIRNSPQGRVAEIAQAHFPMPNLAEIEDSFADGTFKRRNASSVTNVEYQLFYSEYWKRYRRHLEFPTTKEGWKNTTAIEKSPIFDQFMKKNFNAALMSDPILPDRCDDESSWERVPSPIPKRFGLFDALRMDFSIARLRHYTGMSPVHFQSYVLFTNYTKYVRRFIHRCIVEICNADPKSSPKLVISPRNTGHHPDGQEYDQKAIRKVLTEQNINEIAAAVMSGRSPDGNEELAKLIEFEFVRSDSQMPTYHFVPAASSAQGVRPRPNVSVDEYRGSVFRDRPMPGVSLINIGVGPSNARNITDHIAVMRPLCWIMVGHCGGLRQRQKLGDYVIATGYVRRDGVLDSEVPLDLPVHGTRAVNEALIAAAAYHFGNRHASHKTDDWWPDLAGDLDRNDPHLREQLDNAVRLRSRTRSGTVMSTSNRNWETSPTDDMFELFQRYRVVAIDMESATLAANASRYRVPHGTFLCISDRPLHGVIKMKINSDRFYADQINKHLDISLDALRLLQDDIDLNLGLTYPRELTGTDDPPWR